MRGTDVPACKIWWFGTAAVFGAALGQCADSSVLHILGCALLCGALWLLLGRTAAAGVFPALCLSRRERLVLCLPALLLSAAVIIRPFTGIFAGVFFAFTAWLALDVLRRHKALTGTALAMGILLGWFFAYCALSNLCISPDSYSYYEMAKTLFTDFGRVSTIRQYVRFTDYGISFPYFYPLLLAVTDRLTGLGMYGGILLNVFLAVETALLFPLLSRRICAKDWPGVLAAIALLTNRKYLSEVLSGRAIPAAVLCVGVLLLLFSASERWSKKFLLLAGLTAGISMVIRFDNLTVVGFAGLCVLLLSGKGRWGKTVCFGVGAAVPLIPWAAYSLARFGTPWISDNGGTLTLVDITIPQRFFLPDEVPQSLFTDPGLWLRGLGGRFQVVLLLLALTFVSTQILLPGLMLAVDAVRGRLSCHIRHPRGGTALPGLILLFYALKTLAYCLVGYETARYHAETVVLVIFALSCLLAPYVGRRMAAGAGALYLTLALWAGLVYSTPLGQTVPSLCRHPSYAGCLSFGYQKQDESWQALTRRICTQPVIPEEILRGPDWVWELRELIDTEDARVFFFSQNGDPYAYGAYTGQKAFAYVANLNEARCLYLMDNYIKPTHLVISSENDLPWVELLNAHCGLDYLGQVGTNLVYRVGG